MSNTIGRVNFTATVDGRFMKRDAEKVGREAGAAASDGYDETWSKGYDASLTKSGKDAYARWIKQYRKTGKDSAKEFTTIFGREMNSRLKVYLKESEKIFTDLRWDDTFLDRWNEKFKDAGLTAGDVQRRLVTLNETGHITTQVFEASKKQVDDWAKKQKTAAIETNRTNDALKDLKSELSDINDEYKKATNIEAFRKHGAISGLKSELSGLSKEYKEANKSVGKLNIRLPRLSANLKDAGDAGKGTGLKWSKIPHNGRQVLVWTAAIISGFEQMATLGSAAGVGLLTAVGAASQYVVGLGSAIAVFHDLGDELEDLPENIRPTAEAFQGIGDALGDLQDRMQEVALGDSADDFDSIRASVDKLAPAFDPISEAIGNLTESFAGWADVAADEGGALFEFVENSASTFEDLSRSAGTLSEALLDAFNNPTMLSAIEGFNGWIDDLVTSFQKFVNGPNFDDWIGNGVRVLESLGGLLEGVATVLDDLVTEESAERTMRFLDALTGSLPGIGAMLEAFGALDVFGIIAKSLEVLFSALEPLYDVLTPIATIISEGLFVALNSLKIVMDAIGVLLIPAQILWNLMAETWSTVVDWLIAVQEAYMPVLESLKAVGKQIVEAFNPAIEAIGTAIEEMLPSPEEFERFLNENMIPAIEDMADWVTTTLVPAVEKFAEWIIEDGIPAMKDMVKTFNEDVGPVIADVVGWFVDDLGPALSDVGGWIEDNEETWRFWAEVVGNLLYGLLNPIGAAVDAFNTLFGAATDANNAASAGTGGGGGGGLYLPYASGGEVFGPTRALVGEAGPEAIVPLNRPLSQVDESVRWLSSIAQGKAAFASGGVVGGSSVSVAPGAIVIQGSMDPRRQAYEVLDLMAERISS